MPLFEEHETATPSPGVHSRFIDDTIYRTTQDRHTDRQADRQAGMARVAATAVARRANTILAASSRSQRLRRQGRIPSDSDVKEAHRRTYQDNESLRSGLTAGEEQSTSRDDDPRVQGGISEGASTSDQSPKASSALEVHGGSDQASKAAVLIDIMSAAPINMEATIAHHIDSIDPDLLHLLEGRIAAARQLEQDEETVKGMIALYHRLKSEYDRRTASPALRLLDTLLSMMMADEAGEEAGVGDGGEEGGSAAERDGGGKPRAGLDRRPGREDTRGLVRARMQLAFDDSLSLDTDVFTVAQQLAVGEQRFVDELINEQVDAGVFIKEVEALLTRAVEQQVAGKALLAGDGDLGGPGERERLGQVLDQRERTIECVEELLVLARNCWLRRRN